MDKETTPQTHAAWKASIDDTGCVCRMEPIWETMERLEKENQEMRGRVNPSSGESWLCDCKDSSIRRVEGDRPHPAIDREGWFCMGCLTEYVQRHQLTDLLIERNAWLTKEKDLKEHVRSLNMLIGIAQKEIAGLRQLLAASESLAEEYRQCALSSLHNDKTQAPT